MSNPFRYFNSSPEVIRLVVMMYVKYPLSLRNVEDLLAERGIDISHETVRFWWNRFGPMFAAEIRKKRVALMRGYPQWRWHLDEAFVKVNGKFCYLWRAVDHEGEVLESVVTAKRDKAAALNFLNDPDVTNVRNVSSPHWRRWLGVESRCVVPFTSFSENEVLPDGSRPPIWFALNETRPLACFAGVWTRWTSVRKVKEGETTNDLFAFLTTEPNALVGAYHPKAMPVILTTQQEIDLWMTAPAPEALALQRPLPDDALVIVGRGAKKDEGGLAV